MHCCAVRGLRSVTAAGCCAEARCTTAYCHCHTLCTAVCLRLVTCPERHKATARDRRCVWGLDRTPARCVARSSPGTRASGDPLTWHAQAVEATAMRCSHAGPSVRQTDCQTDKPPPACHCRRPHRLGERSKQRLACQLALFCARFWQWSKTSAGVMCSPPNVRAVSQKGGKWV